MPTRMQKLMGATYDRWQKNDRWSKQDFWDQLSADERFAVFLGNMNYQVQNGGFSQWLGNGYATKETVGYILCACDRIGTPAAREVWGLVERFWDAARDFDERAADEDEYAEFEGALDGLDTAYYAIDDQFMADAEAHLVSARS